MALGHAGSDAYVGLETFPNPGIATVRMESDELTAMCPITNQPDFYRATTDHPAGSGATDSLNSALRSLHEPDIIDAKRQAAERLLETCPQGGGKGIQAEKHSISFVCSHRERREERRLARQSRNRPRLATGGRH